MPPLGEAKGGHRPLLGAKSVKYPELNGSNAHLITQIIFALTLRMIEKCLGNYLGGDTQREGGQ